MVKLILPEALQRFAQDKKELHCDIDSLSVLPAYIETHQKPLYDIIFRHGELHGFVNVYLNGKPIIDIKQAVTLTNDDEIELLTSVSGG